MFNDSMKPADEVSVGLQPFDPPIICCQICNMTCETSKLLEHWQKDCIFKYPPVEPKND